MFEWEEKLVKLLEELGEEEVRKGYISGKFGSPGSNKALVTERWLAELDSRRRTAAEEETLSIARRANELSESANSIAHDANLIASNARRSARWANIIAITAMILSVIMAIIGLNK